MSALNFFELQERARQNTHVLVAAFALAVTIVVAALAVFIVTSDHWLDLDLILSPVPWLVGATLLLVRFETRVGRTVGSAVGMAAVAAALLFVLPWSRYGTSWMFHFWRALDMATSPAILMIWAGLTYAFIEERAPLRSNATLALALLPAAMAIGIGMGLLLHFMLGLLQKQPLAALVAAVIPVAVIGGAAYKRRRALRDGGGAVAALLGAQPADPNTTDPAIRSLRNVVEEMAIAAGIVAPKVYVLGQTRINALAAGWSIADAAVIVTHGALQKLTREELQAVVAHEISHIVNGDIELDIRMLGYLAGLDSIANLGRQMMRAIRLPYPIGIPLTVAGAAVFAVGYLGSLLADMIRAGVSHRREYLADASAVQFTRDAAGLIGALRKIVSDESSRAEPAVAHGEVAHMLFEDAAQALFDTHPPLELRIQALDPQGFYRRDAAVRQPVGSALAGTSPPPSKAAEGAMTGVVVAGAVVAAGAAAAAPAVNPLAQVELLRERARAPDTAAAVICALLLDTRIQVKAQQIATIEAQLGKDTARETLRQASAVQAMPPAQRLPLAIIAAGTVRLSGVGELAKVEGIVSTLIRENAGDVFRFALGSLLQAQVRELASPGARPMGKVRLDALPDEVAQLFTVAAHVGNVDATRAARAFAKGMSKAAPRRSRAYAPPGRWPEALESALDRLDTLLPLAKLALIEGLAAVLQHDSRVTPDELALLRAVCARLHCQPPPGLA